MSVNEWELKTKFYFDVKKKIVLSGESKVFAEWQKFVPTLTEQEFIKNLEWLCSDPLDEQGRLTRRIGLTPQGIVHLKSLNGLVTSFVMYPENGERVVPTWNGAHFRVPCDNPNYADKDGMISQFFKIYLSARDRV